MPERYSNWHRLKRATAILLHLKALLRKKTDAKLQHTITVDELRDAEVAILRHVKNKSFGSVPAKTSAIAKLEPCLEDDTSILRVGGRLKNASIPFEAKHPAILPSHHHITCLIIRHYHFRLGHAGPEQVLAEVRQRYWILRGCTTTRRVLRSCLGCAKLTAKPQHQQMAHLPTVRVTPNEPPFTRVGVDYFGPFMVKRARGE